MMQKLFYNLGVRAYGLGVRLASPFSTKASFWLKGRAEQQLPKRTDQKKVVWFHTASLGEFEQARPLIERFYQEGWSVAVSFFSPSGFEPRKHYDKADWLFYLPLDTATNARQLLSDLKPDLVVFVKYEFWYHHLKAVYEEQIPLYLLSANFREEQAFFKGNLKELYREMLGFYTRIFVQHEASKTLLEGIGVNHVSVSGDTRFDRVKQIAGQAESLPVLEAFSKNKKVLILGSSWMEEEKLVAEVLNEYPELLVILAPHDISEAHIEQIEKQFSNKSHRYSKGEWEEGCRILILDNIGMLASAYRVGQLAFVGGGFKNALHNILEPAAHGLPVIFGPKTEKYPEGKSLIDAQGGFAIGSASDLKDILTQWHSNPNWISEHSENAKAWIEANSGAVNRVWGEITSEQSS